MIGLEHLDDRTISNYVRARHPNPVCDYNSIKLENSISGWRQIINDVRITKPENQFRLYCVPALLTSAQRESDNFRNIMMEILYARPWDEDQKVDFIYKHLVPLQPSTI